VTGRRFYEITFTTKLMYRQLLRPQLRDLNRPLLHPRAALVALWTIVDTEIVEGATGLLDIHTIAATTVSSIDADG
jgi:hypothetical protein